MALRAGVRWTLLIILDLVVCGPIAFIATFLMSPFWGWYEAKTGIESLGHSGPADWCFELTYGVVAAAAIVLTVTAFARRARVVKS